MNVASLGLCKELYELSGWDDTAFYWHEDKVVPTPFSAGMSDDPSYDLGYLLRKLPYKLPNTRINHWLTVSMGVSSGVAKYSDSELVKRADTPENAICKLAIALFKEGVLT